MQLPADNLTYHIHEKNHYDRKEISAQQKKQQLGSRVGVYKKNRGFICTRENLNFLKFAQVKGRVFHQEGFKQTQRNQQYLTQY